ncbi:MAG: alanine--tRNA ligase-related protein, partial [Nanoarchaeota archaeon]
QKHPIGKRLVNVQKCIRTGDIDEVGDETHHTFFEMLGNWSLGDYWKKEAIEYSFEFLTKILKIPKEKLEVSCFKGDKDSSKDIEAEKIWKSLGISKIKFLGKENNWWGPAGETGPCGPDTEMFVNNVEIWNDVFMEYEKNKDGKYSEAKQKNIDTGMGVERTLAILNNLEDNYMTEVWKPIIEKIEHLSGKKYKGNEKVMRIIADHIKAAVFIIADGIVPGNKEQGYVLRRLIRRAIFQGRDLKIRNFISKIAKPVFEIYKDYKFDKEKILEELEKEENKFLETLEKGIKVASVPAYGEHTVAEFAFALLLMLSRKMFPAHEKVVKDGSFSPEGLTGFDLCDKNVGVLGTGKIGKNFIITAIINGSHY